MLVKCILAILGTVSLTFGIIGIVIPGLPTTPFLLASAALYFRSSERLYNWLISHKIFGKIIKDYRENKAISFKVKVSALILMWVMILISSSINFFNFYLSLLIIVLGVIGTYVMGKIPHYND